MMIHVLSYVRSFNDIMYKKLINYSATEDI